MSKLNNLIDLFDSIGVKEKGIEEIYDYLLNNQQIDDIQDLVEQFKLSLKRVYKIFNKLKGLDLVQTYDRPMKVILNPPVQAWQSIISKKINEIKHQSTEQIQKCETSYQKTIDEYNLKTEEPELSPVEYINLSANEDPFDLFLEIVRDGTEIKFARDSKFNYQFKEKIINEISKPIQTKSAAKSDVISILQQIGSEVLQKEIEILISDDLAKISLEPSNNKQIDLNKNWGNKGKEIFKKFKIRITHDVVGNFFIKDHSELGQYSIEPSNTVLGMFLSRQQEIVDIFSQKFDKKYKNAISLEEFCKKENYPAPTGWDKLVLTFL
ncbi:MAG: hypothetical protein ACTSVU_02015 [Promethearchaeota archaeon]